MFARLIKATAALLLAFSLPATAIAQSKSTVVKARKGAPWKKLATKYQAVRDFPFRTPNQQVVSVGNSISGSRGIT